MNNNNLLAAFPGTSSIGGGAAPFAWRHLPPALTLNNRHNCPKINRRSTRQQEQCCANGLISNNNRNTNELIITNSLYGGDAITDRSGKLYCRTGFHLQIHGDGRVNGTRQDNSRFGVLEFLSIAFGLVSIRGKETNRYLCMNKNGKLYGSLLHTPDCIFMERMLENYYNTYTSCRYSRRNRRWFVALNKRGKARRGNRSKKKQKFSQFLVLHLDRGAGQDRRTADGRTPPSRHHFRKAAQVRRKSGAPTLTAAAANLPPMRIFRAGLIT